MNKLSISSMWKLTRIMFLELCFSESWSASIFQSTFFFQFRECTCDVTNLTSLYSHTMSELLKSNALDICRYANTVCKSLRSEICVRVNSQCQYMRKALISMYENMDISLAHTQRSTGISQRIHTPIRMRTRRWAANGVRWLACVSNNLCMQ